MPRLLLAFAILAFAVSLPLLAPVSAQDTSMPGQHDTASLKKSLEELAFSVKMLANDPGKEKYQIDMERDGLNLPVAVELSANHNYIWLTLYLGAAPSESSSKCSDLLKANMNVQPSQFYITSKGKLMIGLPIDNRGVTNAALRRCIDKVAGDVVNQKAVWQQST